MRQHGLVIPMVVGLALAAGGTAWAKSETKEKLQMSQNARWSNEVEAIENSPCVIPSFMVRSGHSRKTSRCLGAASRKATRLTRLLFHPVGRRHR